jgi:hypothetical protein
MVVIAGLHAMLSVVDVQAESFRIEAGAADVACEAGVQLSAHLSYEGDLISLAYSARLARRMLRPLNPVHHRQRLGKQRGAIGGTDPRSLQAGTPL